MKTFDLEAAKRGETMCDRTRRNLYFIGVNKSGTIVCETAEGRTLHYYTTDLYMAPKKRTVWVNLLISGKAFHYDTEESANRMIGSSDQRIGGKAYPVEIEE